VYGSLLAAHGLNPLKFFRGAAPGMQVAFVSSSSFASMPAAIRSVTHNLGVDKDYAAFAVPLGASIKMDGCGAIYPALTSVFVAQYFGLHLEPSQYFTILVASVLGSFGTAGVPGTATVMVTLVLSAAGLPLEGIGLLVAIDRVLDMMRTMTNVTGQMLVPVLVAKETGLLNQEVYNAASTNVGLQEGEEPGRESA
jgi:Na+/H+-dicarboxylate symporter